MHDDELIGKLDTTAFMRKFRASRLRTDAMLVGAGLEPHPTTTEPELGAIISVAQAAQMSGLSKREVRRLCGRRVFRCYRTSKAPNAKYRIVRASFEAYLEKRRWL